MGKYMSRGINTNLNTQTVVNLHQVTSYKFIIACNHLKF